MFALGEGKLGWFFRENLNIHSLIWTNTPEMDTQNSLFSEKFKKFFKNTLHYICTGRGQFVGCFAKKFKIAFTYSHWEKPFAHPNSELFTKNSKSPLIMFALGRGKLGWFFEKKFSKSVIVILLFCFFHLPTALPFKRMVGMTIPARLKIFLKCSWGR